MRGDRKTEVQGCVKDECYRPDSLRILFGLIVSSEEAGDYISTA